MGRWCCTGGGASRSFSRRPTPMRSPRAESCFASRARVGASAKCSSMPDASAICDSCEGSIDRTLRWRARRIQSSESSVVRSESLRMPRGLRGPSRDVSLIDRCSRLGILCRPAEARRARIHQETSMVHSSARARSALVLLVGLTACGDGTSPLPSGPPARLEVTSGGTFRGPVGTVLATPLGVQVLDDQRRAVSGVVVRFAIVEGAGSVSPQSVTTGRRGDAQTRLTLGPAAGTYRVHATVQGLDGFAFFIGEATPGGVARVVLTPGQARLAAVGDTMRLRARQYDSYGN